MIDVRTYHVSFFYVIYRSLLKMMRQSSRVEIGQLSQQQVNWNSFFHQRERLPDRTYDWIDYNPNCSIFVLLFVAFEMHHYASYYLNATENVYVNYDCQSVF